MLSSVLKSERAVQVNIEIMRTFVKLRGLITANKNLSQRLDELERNYDQKFRMVFDAIRELMNTAAEEPKRRPIGFRTEEKDEVKEPSSKYGAIRRGKKR